MDFYDSEGRILNKTGVARKLTVYFLCQIFLLYDKNFPISNTIISDVQCNCEIKIPKYCMVPCHEYSYLFLADNYSLRDPYDKILRCLGFKVRTSVPAYSRFSLGTSVKLFFLEVQ